MIIIGIAFYEKKEQITELNSWELTGVIDDEESCVMLLAAGHVVTRSLAYDRGVSVSRVTYMRSKSTELMSRQ
jgi:hypothetical protein